MTGVWSVESADSEHEKSLRSESAMVDHPSRRPDHSAPGSQEDYLLVDQSTNWLTNCSFGLLILVDQMNILVNELINLMTNK